MSHGEYGIVILKQQEGFLFFFQKYKIYCFCLQIEETNRIMQ